MPATRRARSSFPAPKFRLKLAAVPMPIIRAMAVDTVVKGKATLVAAFPKYPTPWPMKI